jgi:AP-1 complex subunit gamma-1
LNERNHAVVLTGVTLMIDIVLREMKGASGKAGRANSNERVFRAVFAQCVPLLCRVLKVLVSGGFAAEYDVSGVSDPYLQVKILQLLRLLSEGDAQVGDSISDILAQVATNVDGGKGAGNAILYECVRTIMSVKGNSGLRVLAVNILGRFLGYRYVLAPGTGGRTTYAFQSPHPQLVFTSYSPRIHLVFTL